MKKIFFLFITLIILLSSCKKASEVKVFPDLTKEEISDERFWERVTEEENYKKYPTWPDYEGMQPGQSPHGRFHKVYINPKLRNALPIESKVAPYGSIIVKENFTGDKELAAFTVMAKIEGYDPKNNDWFWGKYDAEKNVQASGRVQKCADCHAGSNNDSLILRKLDKPIE